MIENRPILFVTESGKEYPYSRPGGGGGEAAPFTYGDKVAHANTILQQLNSVVTAVGAGVVRVSVSGKGGKEFPAQQLDSSGMKLLHLQSTEEGTRQTATVLLPDKGTTNRLETKIRDFRDSVTRGKEKPPNANLVGRIDSFSEAGEKWLFDGGVDELITGRKEWVEIWLGRPEKKEQQDIGAEKEAFARRCAQLQLTFNPEALAFPERLVFSVYADKADVLRLACVEPKLRKCRPEHSLSTHVTSDKPAGQKAWTKDILDRLVPPGKAAPAVCVLDSGCNRHPILEPLLHGQALFSVNGANTAADDEGHGTSMAGIAAYGNLNTAMMNHSGNLYPHPVESCRLFRSADTDRLYGERTQQAVSLAEIGNPARTRVFCLAITTRFQSDVMGAPSSWSAALDASSAMADDLEGQGRLYMVSAGNRREYALDNEDTQAAAALNPSQAWNAVTVGAVTHLTKMGEPKGMDPTKLYAQDGGISPSSTNSLLWEDSAPIKPDIVCEGGNMAYAPAIEGYDAHDDLCLIAPYHQFISRQYDPFNGTSLATALATHLAAAIMRQYPDLRAETVRALMVHSAEWTPEMKRKFLENKTKAAYLRLARICGHGEASIERAIQCMNNSLTLVHEGELTPYKKESTQSVATYNCMVYHELPWPLEALRDLGDTDVEMKVTLSYLVEPSPSALQGLDGRYAYPSCRLRYSVRPATFSAEQHLMKVNAAMRRDEAQVPSRSGEMWKGWQLGEHAFLGSVHSDIWEGSAADLAQKGGIAVYPESGWWKTRTSLKMYDRKVHYALVVSIRTKETGVDLYTEVQNLIANRVSAANEVSSEVRLFNEA